MSSAPAATERRFDHIARTSPAVASHARRPAAHARPAAPDAPAPAAPPRIPASWRRLFAPLHTPEILGGLSQFEHWLKDPELAGLLARDPRAVRVLRGLCRRMGVRRVPELPAILFPLYPRRRPEARKPARTPTGPPRLRDPRPIVERTAVCPDTGRRTFVPWTAELAEYRRHWRLQRQLSKRNA